MKSVPAIAVVLTVPYWTVMGTVDAAFRFTLKTVAVPSTTLGSRDHDHGGQKASRLHRLEFRPTQQWLV